MKNLERVGTCLKGDDGLTDGFATCLYLDPPLRHAENGRPLLLRERPEPGCVQVESDEVVIRYAEQIDYETCRCLGWPVTGIGESGGYNYCAPADVGAALTRRKLGGRQAAWELIRERPFGLAQVTRPPGEEESFELLPPSSLDSELAGAIVEFPVQSVVVYKPRSRPLVPLRVEIEYRRISEPALAQLFAELNPRRLQRDIRKNCFQGLPPIARTQLGDLNWSVEGHHEYQAFPEQCAVARRRLDDLTARLESLPRLRKCVARAEVPFGGAGCFPEVRGAGYLGIRRGHREIRVLTPVLADALCAGLGVVATSR